MFEYKDASFYTSFFNNLQMFTVIEEFKKSEDEEEKNLYVGTVEVVGTIHPLVLRVEIPTTFPHMKLTFRTKSISGYPHLIHTGKIKYGDWFCLNTPFAETVEEQLNQEISRLSEWINHQMRPDLPAVIKDENVIQGLGFANAYDWENFDEMNEFSSKATLTFIGDFYKDPNSFKNKKGHLNCIKTPDNRFYAFPNNEFAQYKLPFIIVDEEPKSLETYRDFVSLKEQYGWGADICEHLLPNFGLSQVWTANTAQHVGSKCSLRTALKKLKAIKQELDKDECYLPASNGFSRSRTKVLTKLLRQQKEIILKEIEKLELEVRKNKGYDPFSSFIGNFKDWDEMSEEEQEEECIRQAEEDYAIEVYPFEYHYFALGIKKQDNITWIIFYTNRSAGQFDIVTFDLGIKDYSVRKLISYTLFCESSQSISKTMYYGRGVFSQNLQNKKIALVGLGAIGSMVAESLARSGVPVIGLWDNDVVEPGNICRSTYLLSDLGDSKVDALASKIRLIDPFVQINEIRANGFWHHNGNNFNIKTYEGGSFYNNINYDNQEDSINKLQEYDLIIDCTGSNELLHFLSYAVPQTDIVSLCITNHANELVCVTSRDGNPFELRKAYLSRIEQDTKNFYLEGSGCYSPTFLATNSDIASLVNLAVRGLNANIEKGCLPHSTIWSHDKRGVLADRLQTYKLEGYDIRMTISSETMYDGEDMEDSPNGHIGYLLGSYSKDGQLIMVTHFVDALNAEHYLSDAFETSKGIIDYIGDFDYSDAETETYKIESFNQIAHKASDNSINTCNPLLAIRHTDGTISFFLFINYKLVKFHKED